MKKNGLTIGDMLRNHKIIVVGILSLFLLIISVGFVSASIVKDEHQIKLSDEEIENPELITDEELLAITEEQFVPETTDTILVGEDAPKIIKFIAPLPKKYMGYKTSPQGLRSPISAVDTGGMSTSGKWHNGWDIACPDKTPVYATKDGYIAEVWPSYYNGPYKYKGHSAYGLVIIKHPDSTISLYAHLSFTEVHEGDYVKAGKEIGWSGGVKGRRGSGTSTGPHLHYSIYMDMDSFIDY